MSPFLDYAGSPASSSDSKAADDAGVEINHLPTNAAEPIAITGLSFKFPQDATSYETFWEMLSQGRNAMTDFPNSRLNLHAFHHPDPNRMDTLTVRGGHFLKEDVAFFDAPFFSITANEAESMDPQQRGLLEAAYLALENAGMPMEQVLGTKTAVFTGSFADDTMLIGSRDLENLPKYACTGWASTMLSNRVSWFFGLTGPSVNLDSACSSSMMALDMGCQALRSGDASMALVGGSNTIFGPDFWITLNNMGFLSPDSLCYSFDHRANGYARGEGFSFVVLKRVSDAVRDNDTIRAVIRSTGSNQDGHTPGITQPSRDSQERLIRETYEKAGLSMTPTRFFEAHGTGTALGDPIEAAALGGAFKKYRSSSDPLYIGAVKSNIGHLEGASGIAGLIKAILVLEKGIIPPNCNFERLNPKIDAAGLHLKFPSACIPWPTDGLRRASVNSFGFGGSNSHAVIDDAYNYMRIHGIRGNHASEMQPSRLLLDAFPDPNEAHHQDALINDTPDDFKLLVWSSADEQGLSRLNSSYVQHFQQALDRKTSGEKTYLSNLAYTLECRRSRLPWRSFAVVNSVKDLPNLRFAPAIRSKNQRGCGIGFVFTGQGAQYRRMGKDCVVFDAFRDTITECDRYLQKLGCPWTVAGKMWDAQDSLEINSPEYSQPLCTVLQIALVNLLRTLGVRPATVVGHSSGEIAAAYCAGGLSMHSACKVAYFRGKLAATIPDSKSATQGAMISVALSETDILPYFEEVKYLFPDPRLTVACINSPSNITVSGNNDQIDALRLLLDDAGIFARKLQVNVAYHSPHMESIVEAYRYHLQDLQAGDLLGGTTSMISSVTGRLVDIRDLSDGQYWVDNMRLPVRFLDAARGMVQLSGKRSLKMRQKVRINTVLEIGPHSALQRPVKEILESIGMAKEVKYTPLLVRDASSVSTIAHCLGRLFAMGHEVTIQNFNRCHDKVSLPTLPEYPFDHSQTHWYESTTSKNFRLRKHARHDLLGTTVLDWNPLEPTWRKTIRISETPWVEDHKINGTILYPAAGMIVMPIEAARQLLKDDSRIIKGYHFKRVKFHNALTISLAEAPANVRLHLRPLADSSSRSAMCYEFIIHHCDREQKWHNVCDGTIQVAFEEEPGEVDAGKEFSEKQRLCNTIHSNAVATCTQSVETNVFYEYLHKLGLQYGPTFQPLHNLAFNDRGEAVGDLTIFQWLATDNSNHPQEHVIHPTTLDGMAQILYVALTNGAQDRTPTTIPTSIQDLWIKSSGILSQQGDETATIQTYCKLESKTSRSTESHVFALNRNSGDVLISIEKLRTTTVSIDDASDGLQGSDGLCHTIHWAPDLKSFESGDIEGWCQADQPQHGEEDQVRNNSTFIKPLVRYIQALINQKPKAKILEVTSQDDKSGDDILERITQQGMQSKSPHYRRVHLVDGNSPNESDVPAVGTIDLVQDLAAQGFALNSYDLLILKSEAVIDPTKATISKTLTQASSLLKESGKVAIFTTTSPADNALEQALMQSNFSGVDLRLSSANHVNGRESAILMSTVGQATIPEVLPRLSVLIAETSDIQQRLAGQLCQILNGDGPPICSVISCTQAAINPSLFTQAVCISLLEIDYAVLHDPNEPMYLQLQTMLTAALGVVWVTSGGGIKTISPELRMVDGLLRVLRTENLEKRFATLALEAQLIDEVTTAKKIATVIRQTFESDIYEPEYVEKGGILHIPRLLENHSVGDSVRAKTTVTRTRQPLRELPPVTLHIETPGLLDTLTFVDDETVHKPLQPREIEIQVHAVGVNFMDCLTALGRINQSTFGGECSGVVVRAGDDSRFKPGDRVCAFVLDCYKTLMRLDERLAVKFPDSLSFSEAAAVPVTVCTSYHALVKVARLQRGESILIQAAAGGTGQAAVQIAKLIDAEIFATVGSDEKKRFLMDEYGIPEDHIFFSRNTTFAQGILRVTKGRGVDVVLNSLAGQFLVAGFECIASYGRFVEIGKADTHSDTATLPMLPFARNVSFSAVDLAAMTIERPDLVQVLLQSVMGFVELGSVSHAKPLHLYRISEVEDAFRFLQSGKSTGKVVCQMGHNDEVNVLLNPKPTYCFPSGKTYVIAGGLGGLGRSTARWMVERGARHLILLSRSGPRNPESFALLDELAAQGAHVEAPACDIGDDAILSKVLAECSDRFPEIGGCIQGTMVLRDAIFEKMTFDDWTTSTRSKVQGSWNLHRLLPQNLEFFVLLSSISGVIGSGGQANYAAGNTYEDSLADHRRANGQAATSIDLGWMASEGVVAENDFLQKYFQSAGFLKPVSQTEYFALLETCIATPESVPAQVVIGLESPSAIRRKGVALPEFMTQPLFSSLFSTDASENGDTSATASGTEMDFAALLRARPDDEQLLILTNEVAKKLAKPLSMPVTDIDTQRPMHAYGVDSLLAVELRNWIARKMKADVPVFDIMGASSINAVASLIVARSKFRS